MILSTDEAAIMQVPTMRGGRVPTRTAPAGQDKDVAEITGLMSRAGKWPGGLRWIVRRVKPSRRQMANLTAYEKRTGWRYSIACTNIPQTGMPGVPGSHHPQYIDAAHHASTPSWRRAASGPPRPWARGTCDISEAWAVNRGWGLAANMAADLTAWTRLLGLRDGAGLREAHPGTLRPTGSGTSPPAWPATSASAS